MEDSPSRLSGQIGLRFGKRRCLKLTWVSISTTIHNLMKTKVFLIALAVGLAVPAMSVVAAADRSADEQQIRKIEQDWINAIVKRDGAFLTKLEADDFTLTDPDGTVLDKAGSIKETASGETMFDEVKIDNLKVRFYGDTAIVNGQATAKVRTPDQDLSGQYAWTDVFVKQNGEWKAVAAHVTMIERPPEA
jgi:ketosteroid isomerase-like protein